MDKKQILANWIDEYGERLLRIATMYTFDSSSAEDRLHDAFIKAYGAMEKLQKWQDPFPWLVRIVVNECHNSNRRRWREKLTDTIPDDVSISVEDVYFRNDENKRIHSAVRSLPEKYRGPIILFHFEELSLQEISEALDLNIQTVKTRLVRGRQLLREYLKEDRGDEGQRKVNCSTVL